MSGFISTVATGLPLIDRSDLGACEWATSGDLYLAKLWDRIPADDYGFDTYFGNEWWPSRSSLMGGWDGEPSNQLVGDAPWFAWPSTRSGCNGRLGFVGYTRDQYGTPLANCTVRCIRASTDEMVSKVTSDANGFYIATTPYSDAHFLVVHDATGAIAGASVNTLLPG